MTLLNQANQQYGLDFFLKNTVQPFLKEIGRLWQEKAWDESQETILSLDVRDFLTLIDRSFSNNIVDHLILGFCLPNDNYEFHLQILLLQFEFRGWRTFGITASS